MLYIETNSFDPYYNLAAEEYLVKNKKEDICMLWRNNPCIVIGRSQNAMAEIDYDYVKKNNITVVRRMSGGGAVFHDLQNLNFTYIINGGKFGNYVGLTDTLRQYVNTLGINCEVSGRNDVLAEGRKFSGNAQYVWHGRLMHHGTILINADMSHLAAALRPDETKIASKGVKSVRSRVVNLAELADTDAERFMHGFEQFIKQDKSVRDYTLTEEEKAAIKKLRDEKYATFEWNFGYSPKYTFKSKKRFPAGGVEVFLSVKDGTIENIKIFGDFFTDTGTEVLENALRGCVHDKDALDAALKAVWSENILGGIQKDEFLSCLI